MTENETLRYENAMQQALESYNNRRHRMIKTSPANAERPESHDAVRMEMEQYYRKKIYKGLDNSVRKKYPKKPKYRVGDWVRRVKVRQTFFRSFHTTFDVTIYEIAQILTNLPSIMYILKDLESGQLLPTRYYESEIQKVNPSTSVFKIRRVHRGTRRANPVTGLPEVKVSFLGLPDTYDEYVSTDRIGN